MTIDNLKALVDLELPDPIAVHTRDIDDEDVDDEVLLRFGIPGDHFDLFEDGQILGEFGGEYEFHDVVEIADGLLGLMRYAPALDSKVQAVLVRLADVTSDDPVGLRWVEEHAAYEPGDEFLRFGFGNIKFDLYPDGVITGYNDRPYDLEDVEKLFLSILSLLRTVLVRSAARAN